MASPLSMSALFVGKEWKSGEEEGSVEEVMLSISLFPSSQNPSAFGAFAERDTLVHGTFHPSSLGLQLTEIDVSNGSVTRTYALTLQQLDDDTDALVGAYVNPQTGERGQVCLSREQSSDHHATGCWVGEAQCLQEGIPTNPIRWQMTLLLSTNSKSRCFGCGYFDDSADVEGKPVLFFRLHGDIDENRQISLIKRYEGVPDYFVKYRGSLNSHKDELTGQWDNEDAASNGTFFASCFRPTLQSFDVVAVCSTCNALIAPGRSRWRCRTCPQYLVCSAKPCGEKHEHKLHEQLFEVPSRARGHWCRQIVWNALHAFGKQDFLGWFDDEDLQMKTYADALEDVKRAAAILLERGVKPKALGAICGPTNYWSAIWMLAMIVSDIVVCPMETTSWNEIVPDAAIAIVPGGSSDREIDVRAFLTTSANDFVINNNKDVPRNDNDLVCILFTSGTTGKPKGARFVESLCRPTEGVTTCPFVRADVSRFDPSYVPSLLQTMCFGGSRVHVNLTRLLAQLKMVRPTHFGAPPSVWKLLQSAFLQDPKLDKEALGGRLEVCTSGGSALPRGVVEFFRKRLGMSLINLYGSRETGGIARDGKVYKGVHVLVWNQETMSASKEGSGEILVHSSRMIDSYTQQADKFMFLDGVKYFRTGDFGYLMCQDDVQLLDVVDRTDFLAKDANSTWISPVQIENAIESSPLIVQSFVFVREGQIVCVVVPKADAEVSLEDIVFWCKHHNQPAPVAMLICKEPFSPENGLLNASLKKVRSKLLERFGKSAFSSEKAVQHELNKRLVDAVSSVLPHVPLQASTLLAHSGATSAHLAELTIRCPELSLSDLLHFDLGHLSEMLNRLVGTAQPDWNQEITQLLSMVKNLHRVQAQEIPAQRVFALIGSSGFLGKQLSRSLSKQGEVICYSRSSTPGFDLTQPLLGIKTLPDRITDVVVSAAVVNHMLPYSELRSTNVMSLIELLRLLQAHPHVRRIHFISSVDAMCGVAPADETYRQPSLQQLSSRSGYAQCKAICEIILSRVSQSFCSVSLYRMGAIGWASQENVFPENDFSSELIRLCVKAKCVVDPKKANLTLNWVPVDVLSDAISLLTSTNTSNLHVFHFWSSTPRVGDIFEQIVACVPDCKVVSTMREWIDCCVNPTNIPNAATRQLMQNANFVTSPSNSTLATEKTYGILQEGGFDTSTFRYENVTKLAIFLQQIKN